MLNQTLLCLYTGKMDTTITLYIPGTSCICLSHLNYKKTSKYAKNKNKNKNTRNYHTLPHNDEIYNIRRTYISRPSCVICKVDPEYVSTLSLYLPTLFSRKRTSVSLTNSWLINVLLKHLYRCTNLSNSWNTE